jgi:integrase
LLEYTIPVIFRLQYACGMRPQEARKLRRADISVSGKTIYIADGKHYKDRRLAVSEHVMEMCGAYDRIAEKVIPGRTYFFQSPTGNPYSSCWLSDKFTRCWEMSGNGDKRGKCVPYSLRHRYATETLTRWLDEGKELEAWIPYLSAYRGHASFSATYHYLHLLPERLARMDCMRTNHIIPKAADYEEII